MGEGFFQIAPLTATTDRVCALLTPCILGDTYETTAPTATSDRSCGPVRGLCDADLEAERRPPTLTSDRVCSSRFCLDGFYERVADQGADPECLPHSVCGASQYERAAPSPFFDRDCAEISSACEVGISFEAAAPTATTDRICEPIRACDDNTQWEVQGPTPVSDRVCLAVSACEAEEHEAAAPTATSDRVCIPNTACSSLQYEEAAPGPAADRVCVPLTTCLPVVQYAVPPGQPGQEDRVCAHATACDLLTEYESVPWTATSDRACLPFTRCREVRSRPLGQPHPRHPSVHSRSSSLCPDWCSQRL